MKDKLIEINEEDLINEEALTIDMFEIIGNDDKEAEKINRPSISFWQDVWRRFKSNKVSLIAMILFLSIAIMTVIGPGISKYKFTTINKEEINMTPNKNHWFGTDDMGRDLFARVWKGGRVSIVIGIAATFIIVFVGSIYGGIAGYYGGTVDTVMMRIVEVIASMPTLIITILLSLVMGRSPFSLILALTAFSWTGAARMVRGQVLQLKEQEFVLAAKSLGASPARIIFKHLIPNTLGILMVYIALCVPGFIFSEAFLSYIGLGVAAPNTSWGALAALGQSQLMFYPYQLFFPCLFISLVMLSFNLLGDGLNDAIDPQLRQ